MKLNIVKKQGDIIFWAIDTKGLTYNSEISVGEGVTLLVIYEGRNYITMSGNKTLGSIINPDRATKFMGGLSKLSCKIYAFDESSVFKGSWGLGDLKFKDPKTLVEYKARANGTYDFKIVSLEDFEIFMKVNTETVLKQDDVKVIIRDELHSMIQSILMAKLNEKGLLKTKSDSGFAAEVKDVFNGVKGGNGMKSSGIRLQSFRLDYLDHSEDALETEKRVNEARIGAAIAKIGNETARDAAEILQIAKGTETVANAKIVCAKCKEINDESAIYCKKCGERLI